MKYKVKSLDVWGNKEDGYEINQEFYAGDIEIPDTEPFSNDDQAILDILIEKGFLKEHVTLELVEVEDFANGVIWINEVETGEPLYILEYET